MMDEKTYQRMLLHTESLRFIVTDLETTLRLAHELEPSYDVEPLDPIATTAEAITKMLAHVGKIEERIAMTKQRLERMAKLFRYEVEFAAAEKKNGK